MCYSAIQNERDRIGSTKRRKRSLAGENNSDSEGTPSPKIDIASASASRRLVEMLLDIENRLIGNQSINALLHEEGENKSSRQRAVSTIIGWTNMLHPFPELPFTDKVKHSILTKNEYHCAYSGTVVETLLRSLLLVGHRSAKHLRTSSRASQRSSDVDLEHDACRACFCYDTHH